MQKKNNHDQDKNLEQPKQTQTGETQDLQTSKKAKLGKNYNKKLEHS